MPVPSKVQKVRAGITIFGVYVGAKLFQNRDGDVRRKLLKLDLKITAIGDFLSRLLKSVLKRKFSYSLHWPQHVIIGSFP